MNTHHTSGPWIEKELPHGAIYIEAHPDLNNGHNIAKCFGPDRKANARLIAAAPELLEALKELIAANEEADAAFSRYRGSCEDDPHFTAKQKRMEYARGRQDVSRESARAAIAKATQS